MVPLMEPPSVTAATSYPPAVLAAGADDGRGGMSLVGCSLVPRLQLAAIAKITKAPHIERPRFTRTSGLKIKRVSQL